MRAMSKLLAHRSAVTAGMIPSLIDALLAGVRSASPLLAAYACSALCQLGHCAVKEEELRDKVMWRNEELIDALIHASERPNAVHSPLQLTAFQSLLSFLPLLSPPSSLRLLTLLIDRLQLSFLIDVPFSFISCRLYHTPYHIIHIMHISYHIIHIIQRSYHDALIKLIMAQGGSGRKEGVSKGIEHADSTSAASTTIPSSLSSYLIIAGVVASDGVSGTIHNQRTSGSVGCFTHSIIIHFFLCTGTIEENHFTMFHSSHSFLSTACWPYPPFLLCPRFRSLLYHH